MQIIDNRALQFVTRKADQITALIPKSKVLARNGDQAKVLVNWGHVEAKLLRNLQIKNVPHPITGRYKWPGVYTPFDHQRTTAAFLATHPRCLVLSEAGCVDSDTEYLTPTGWQRIADYKQGPVAQFLPTTGGLEFVEPSEYIKKPCDLMVRMQTDRGVDQLLSPEHRVLTYDNAKAGKHVVMSAADMLMKHDNCYAKIHDPKGPTQGTPTVSFRHAAIRPHFRAPNGMGIPLTNIQLRVQIAVIADGYFSSKHTLQCVVRLKRERKISRLRHLLETAEISFTERNQNTATAVGFVVFTFLAPLRTKEFGAEFWAATTAQLAVVRDEVMHWDGCDRGGNKGLEFSSTSKASADFVQYAFAGDEYVTNVAEDRRPDKYKEGICYSVYVRQKQGTGLLALHSSSGPGTVRMEQSTDGFKYCFSVPSTFLVLRRNGCIFTTGNTGKTSAAAWAADYLMLQGEIKRVLIVCPVSIMDTAWRADLFRTLMHRTVAIATGSKAKRQQLISGDYEFVIINFDGVKVVREELAAGGFDLVIVDEATAVKSTTTDRWKALHSLIKPTTRLWLMTGTPASQSPTDAYGLAKLVNPSVVPKFFGAFRDLVMYKITNFKWAPKVTAQDTVFKVLQPAIRFTKAECLDLPDLLYTTRDVPLTVQQMKYYEEVRKSMVAVAAGSEITAVNAAGLLNKLLQISCIAYNTEVLTDAGWIPIQLVTPQHHVWDGVEWVSQQGAIFRGVKPLVAIAGVRMTAEHKVLTNDGWATADDILKSRSSGIRLDWAKVRFPDGTGASSISPARHSVCKMGVPVRLRSACGAAEPVSSQYEARASKKLWVPPRERNAQNDTGTPVSHMVRYAAEMFRSKRQRLPKLWSAWDNCVQTLGGFFRELLGRHAGGIRRELDAGSNQRRGAVQPKELSMGYGYGASQQYTVQPLDRYAKRAYDCGAGRTGLRAKDGDPKCATETVRLAAGESPHYAGTERVYDLLNCGPRSRFVVRGHNGAHLIVHNCGAAYTTDREVIEFDVSNRVNELLDVIEQTTHKVIVFVPFRHALEMLEQALAKAGIATESIHGGVSAGQRAESIKRFQTEERPKALLLIPQAAAHGITLTKADTVVWWGPVPSAELYLQGNARAHRAGQVNKVTVVRLQGSPVERRVYAMLDGKVDLHQGLVDLYRQEIA